MKQIIGALLLVLLWCTVAVAAVDLNSATQQELEALPGVGPTKAAAIIKYRQKHGPFLRVEDLTEVNGIGQKTIATIKDRVEVNDEVETK